jgi:ATP/maltotriose-dependent transcriptional regulator MalT
MDFDTLRSALGESLAISRELGDETSAAVTLQYLGWGALSGGDFAAATAHYQAAVPVLRARKNRWGLAHALLGLGHLALEAGDVASARSQLDEAMQLMTVMDPWRALIFAVDVARLAVAADEAERGARLLGAIGVLAGPDLQALPVVFRLLHERALAEARRELSDAAFEAARAKGRSLSFEQTIAEAEWLTAARSGAERLSSRELEVLGLVADGLSNAEIATRLFVSDRTVHAHLRTIYRKLGVGSRTAAVRAAVDHGLLG